MVTRLTGFTGCAVIMTALMTAGCASRQERVAEVPPARAPEEPSNLEETSKKAGQIVTQPARDIGVAKTGIPTVLGQAAEDPYSLAGLGSCKRLAQAIFDLNEVLGPDFALGDERKENRAGKIAEAGGKTIVNALIPFRGLVRELTGAAPAQRRLNAAIDAGYARRGFLRGVHSTKGCRLNSP